MMNPFVAESRFDASLLPYRKRADRIMVGMNMFLTLVCLALAPWHDSWIAFLLIALPTLALSFLLHAQHPGALSTRVFMGCAFMAYTGLIIHQSAGDIEAHFAAFGLIGILLYYRDWRTIVAATAFIYLHHLVLGYAQTLGAPVYVFDNDRFWLTFITHVAYFLPFIGMMVYLSVWLRRDGYEAQHVILLAQEIVQGNLVEHAHITTDEEKLPLISAVLLMKNRLLDLLRVLPVPAAVIRIDTESIVNVNEAWENIFGTCDDTSNFSQCPIWADPHSWANLLTQLHKADNKLLNKVEVNLIGREGAPLLCELSIILHDDAKPVMAILSVDDVTQRRRAEQVMHRLAYRDMLTELPNRTSLHIEIERALQDSRNLETPFALMMLDLDGFKPVNDTYGHDAGDEVLKIVGQRILQINRASDFAARLGGDEFVILLRNCASLELAQTIGQRFVDSIARPMQLTSAQANVTIGTSAGLTHISLGAKNAEELLKQADEALYAAKHAGKNRIAIKSSAATADAD